MCKNIIARIGELVTVGEGETPIENFQYSPWMPFGNLLKEENQICEYRRGGAPSGIAKESKQRPKRIPHTQERPKYF